MRILLVQTGFLGDTVLSTPCLEAIRSKHPGAEIWVMTNPLAAELLRHDARICGIIAFAKRGDASGLSGLIKTAREIKRHNFTIVYSLHRSARTALLLWLARIPQRIGSRDARLRMLYTRTNVRPVETHAVLRHLAIIGVDLEAQKQKLTLTLPPQDSIAPSILDLTNRKLAVLFPGSEWETKRWWWQHYLTLAQELQSRGFTVVLLGSNAERELCTQISKELNIDNLAGKLSIGESMFVVSKAALLVCNDSLALHLGSAFSVPTVAIFCATSPRFGFGPWQNPRGVVVEKGDLECKPCRRHGSRVCPTGTEACMRELYPLAVLHQIDRMLAL